MSLNHSSSLTLPRTRIVPAIVAVAFFMQMLDGTIIATSLPAMAATFDTDVVTLNIGFTVYLLAMAVFIPPAGWLADRLGAKQVFLSAIALFTLSSVACGLSETLGEFTIARLVQGASAALMTPVGRQLVLRDTPKSELVSAIATITWPALIAPVIGPLVGAWITTHAGWEWNFFINIPLGLIGIVLVAVFIPPVPAEDPRPFDVPGFLLTTVGLASTLTGLELISTGNGGIPGVMLMTLGLGAG